MATKTADILIIGATGYTGRSVARYLATHPDKSTFTYAIAGRSLEKLKSLAQKLNLGSEVPLVTVDTTSVDSLRDVIQKFSVVINCVGPYWKTGAPIVEACVISGVHYTDVTGESYFVRDVITRYDFLASKSKTLIIPEAGFDSIPSDLLTNLGVKHLKKLLGPNTTSGTSSTAFNFVVFSAASGGTVTTFLDTISGVVPKKLLIPTKSIYSLSPVQPPRKAKTVKKPGIKFVYKLPFTNIVGSFFVMSPVNIRHVYRTWGLYQHHYESNQSDEAKAAIYGPNFSYSEFSQSSNTISAFFASLGLAILFFIVSIPPFTFIARKLAPVSGSATLPDEDLHKGKAIITNVTASDSASPTVVKTSLTVNMDVYLFTAVSVAEVALCLLPQNSSTLTAIGKNGGVLTPLAAIDGDVLAKRLESTGKISVAFEQIEAAQTKKDK